MKKGNAEIYYRMNFMMLMIVSILFLGGVLSTYMSYIKYGLNYDVITIIKDIEIIEKRTILKDMIFVVLFALLVLVSFMNCRVYSHIRKYLEGEKTEE